jgi:hypothetical protein
MAGLVSAPDISEASSSTRRCGVVKAGFLKAGP